MATNSQGIQQLLSAEKKAAEIVAEARKRRTKRLKQAKDEAGAEVESYKQEKEKVYKQLEQQILGSKSSSEDSSKKTTDTQIEEMNRLYTKNRKEVIGYVLNMVENVVPQKHQNLII